MAIKQETYFTLPAGTGRVALENLLLRDHVIANTGLFPWLLRIEPELANFKAGTYRFTPGMTVREMLELLVSGKEAQFTVRLLKVSACVIGWMNYNSQNISNMCWKGKQMLKLRSYWG